MGLQFTFDDIDDAPEDLTVTAESLSPSIVSSASITVSGAGTTRTLALTPVADAFGPVTIRVSVFDGEATVHQFFPLTVTPVNDAPQMAAIGGPFTIAENSSIPVWIFLDDIDGTPFDVGVIASSSNQQLVPDASLIVTGGATNRTLNVTPTFGAHGQVTITLTASDGLGASSQRTFDLIVTDVTDENAAPTIEVTNGVGIAVERAMYWTSNGIFLAGGTGATATRLP